MRAKKAIEESVDGESRAALGRDDGLVPDEDDRLLDGVRSLCGPVAQRPIPPLARLRSGKPGAYPDVRRCGRVRPGPGLLAGNGGEDVGAVGPWDDEGDRATTRVDADDRDGLAPVGPGREEPHRAGAGQLSAHACGEGAVASTARRVAGGRRPPESSALGGAEADFSFAVGSSSTRMAAGSVTSPMPPRSPLAASGASATEPALLDDFVSSPVPREVSMAPIPASTMSAAAAAAEMRSQVRPGLVDVAPLPASVAGSASRMSRRRVMSSSGATGSPTAARPCSSASSRAGSSDHCSSRLRASASVIPWSAANPPSSPSTSALEGLLGVVTEGRGRGRRRRRLGHGRSSVGRRTGSGWFPDPSVSSVASAARPRAIRDRTVPGGTSSTAAICA